MKSIAWDHVSLASYHILARELNLRHWKTRVLDLVHSTWQAKAMNGNGILAESFIFFALTKFCQINMLEGAYGETNVLR